mgnify:CR=1 FL=1
MLNEEVLKIIRSTDLEEEDVVSFLVSLYYGNVASYFPSDFIARVGTLGLYNRDEVGLLQWKYELFQGGVSKTFEWVVSEYIPLFIQANPLKRGAPKDVVSRMKKLFAENPEIRKDEIIGGTVLYLRNTDSTYIRLPHYFISKGAGSDKTNDILVWVDKYREGLVPSEASGSRRVLQ